MAEDNNKDLGDMAEDAMDSAKKGAEKLGDKAGDAFDDAKKATKDFAEDAKEATKDFAEDAKETAQEFTENVKEVFTSKENKKILAGILAILIGWLGVHKFILGYQKEGIIMAAIGILGWFLCGIPTTIVAIVGLIEGIMYLTKSDEEFYNTYQVGQKPWF